MHQNHAPSIFIDTVPNDAGPDYQATEDRVFPSVEGHREGLDVQALIGSDSGRLLVHIGGACMDWDGAAALVQHLGEILVATESADGNSPVGITIA